MIGAGGIEYVLETHLEWQHQRQIGCAVCWNWLFHQDNEDSWLTLAVTPMQQPVWKVLQAHHRVDNKDHKVQSQAD